MTDNIVDKNTPEFVSFLKGVEKIVTDHFDNNFPILEVPTFEVNNGRRYFKIVRVDNQRSVHVFVDRTNGDVLKAASWKTPAKHSRGNIFNKDNGLDCMTPYGATYLK
jgi:hypothetical protein